MELYSGLSDRKHNQTPRTVQTFFALIPPQTPPETPTETPTETPLYILHCYCSRIFHRRNKYIIHLIYPINLFFAQNCTFSRSENFSFSLTLFN